MRKFLRPLSYMAIFALLSAGAALVTYRVMVKRMTVEVPDLEGMQLAEAERALKARGLSLGVAGEDYSPQTPAGHVLGQDVPAGDKVKGMSEINVIMSKGPAVEKIPGVAGKRLDDALRFFAQNKLEAKVIKVHSDAVAKDTVIAQWPAPEEWQGQEITLLASAGPYKVEYYCPSFVGLFRYDAVRLAEELGLDVEISDPGGDEAAVSSQKPLPGERIARGDALYLTMKRGSYD